MVPVFGGVKELLAEGIAPGGTHRNLESVDSLVKWHPTLSNLERLLLCDAQTSGGLLMAVAADRRELLLRELEDAGVQTRAPIGEVVERDSLGGPLIEVLP